MKWMKNIAEIFFSIVLGFLITNLFSTSRDGFPLNSFWSGMYLYLDKTGFPFLWQTKCPISNGVPTGCVDGFNTLAFYLNILIFATILFIIIKIVDYIIGWILSRF